jgi:hypothetical protein
MKYFKELLEMKKENINDKDVDNFRMQEEAKIE